MRAALSFACKRTARVLFMCSTLLLMFAKQFSRTTQPHSLLLFAPPFRVGLRSPNRIAARFSVLAKTLAADQFQFTAAAHS